MNGKDLLADILKWDNKEIEDTFLVKDNYKFIPQRKKDGSIRKIFAPAQQLKKFQRRFLKFFLYRIPLDIFGIIKGFRPGCSYVDNARAHLRHTVRFVLALDFEDAFPSVKGGYLKTILSGILMQEIENLFRERPSVKPLFSVKKAEWFRHLIDDFPQLNLFCDIESVIEEFLEIAVSLTTYRGRLPQGAPTSPYLLNIVLYYSGLMEKIMQFLWDKEVLVSDNGISQMQLTFYADDMAISSSTPISRPIIDDLINLIEKESPFRINRRKVAYFKRDRISPLITGLRMVSLAKKGNELDDVLKNIGLTSREKKNLKRKMLDGKGEWIVDSISLPKRKIRRIRGIIHRASIEGENFPLFKKIYTQKVNGYIACLNAIYGSKLPKQIKVPYQKYLNSS